MLLRISSRLMAAASTAVICSLFMTSPVQASPKNNLKKYSQKTAKEMRENGAPNNVCFLNIATVNGHIANAHGKFKYGDDVLYINNHDTSNISDNEIGQIVKRIPPEALVPVRVVRDGEQIDFNVQCENKAYYENIMLKSLDFASKGRFNECVAELDPIALEYSDGFQLMYRCASVSTNAHKYDIPKYLANMIEQLIMYSNYKEDWRPRVMQDLRGSQNTLKPDDYNRLVHMTKAWSGDEVLFEETQPDWNRFRVNAESAVLSGFFDPSSAVFEWPYGFTYGSWKPVLRGRIEGYWTCGKINAKNRMGGYVGSRYFVVVLDRNAQVLYNEVGAGGRSGDLVSLQCQNSIKNLPPASTQFVEIKSKSNTNSTRPSMADELSKLAGLKANGSLTEEEYRAAKMKVLQGD